MKAGNLGLTGLVFVLLTGCANEKDEKKDAVKAEVRDTAAVAENLPSLEKEFADTVNAKPVKDSVLLKFNFQKGKIYDYTMALDALQKKEELSRGTSMKWNYQMKVTDEKKDLKTIEATYKRIDMTMNMGNEQKMEFSSEKQVDPADFMQLPSKMFSIIKGKSFTMQVNEKGEVVAVSGFDKIGEAVVSEMNLPEEMKPMMRQNFQKQFNDETVKQLFSQSFNVVPARYVKVGDTWTNTASITAAKQNVTTVYKVKNIRGNRVYLTGESKLTSTDGKKTGTQTSQFIMDARTGLMINGAFNQKSGDGQSTTSTKIVGKEY